MIDIGCLVLTTVNVTPNISRSNNCIAVESLQWINIGHRRLKLVNIVNVTGETLQLKHISRGQDKNATLQTDIIVNGQVPVFSETSTVKVLPYVEDFVQLAAGKPLCTVTTCCY